MKMRMFWTNFDSMKTRKLAGAAEAHAAKHCCVLRVSDSPHAGCKRLEFRRDAPATFGEACEIAKRFAGPLYEAPGFDLDMRLTGRTGPVTEEEYFQLSRPGAGAKGAS